MYMTEDHIKKNVPCIIPVGGPAIIGGLICGGAMAPRPTGAISEISKKKYG